MRRLNEDSAIITPITIIFSNALRHVVMSFGHEAGA
jgi:hypothetical protein